MIVAFVPCLLLPASYLADPDKKIFFCLFMATFGEHAGIPGLEPSRACPDDPQRERHEDDEQ